MDHSLVSDASQECSRQREDATKGRGPHRKPVRYKTPPHLKQSRAWPETKIGAVAATRLVTLPLVVGSAPRRVARVHHAPLARATLLLRARRVSLVLFHPWD